MAKNEKSYLVKEKAFARELEQSNESLTKLMHVCAETEEYEEKLASDEAKVEHHANQAAAADNVAVDEPSKLAALQEFLRRCSNWKGVVAVHQNLLLEVHKIVQDLAYDQDGNCRVQIVTLDN